jgi:centrosomal protein CEP290
MFFSVVVLRQSLSEQSSRATELEQEVEVLEGELSAAQQAAKQAPSRTMKALVDRLRNQLSVKEKQQRVRRKEGGVEGKSRKSES